MTILLKSKIRFILIFISLSLLYFLSRLQNLTAIPIFGDEAIYLRWSQIIRNVETLRFIPLTDGKQPLFMWITASLIQYIKDPLVAGRLVSVFSGWGTMISMFLLSSVFIYQPKPKSTPKNFFTGLFTQPYLLLFTGLVYILTPFTFFFDRLALADNLLSFFVVFSFFLTILLSRFPRLDISLILGATLGLAWLTKSPALFFVILSFLTFVFYNYSHPKLFIYPLLSSLLAFFIYNTLRLGPQFHMIAIRNSDYVWSLDEIIKHPLDPLKPHISDIVTIYRRYIGLPLIFSIPILLSSSLLASWWLLPLLGVSAVAKVFTARYVLYTLPPLLCLMSLSLYSKFPKKISLLLLVLLSIPQVIFIKNLSLNSFNTHLPNTESGYTADWTSGWGIKQAASYLQSRAKQANVIVGTEGHFGTLPDGLQVYTDGTPSLTIIGVGLGFSQIPPQLVDAYNHGDEVYLLINQSRLNLTPDQLQKLRLTQSYPKPGNDQLLLFQL